MTLVVHVTGARRLVIDGRTRGLEATEVRRIAVACETEREGELIACQIAACFDELIIASEIVEVVL